MSETFQLGDIEIAVTRKAVKNVHLSVHPPAGQVTLVAPTGTAPETVDAWSKALQAALKSPAVLARFEALALEPLPGTPAQMLDYWRSERSKWGQVIQAGGVKLD